MQAQSLLPNRCAFPLSAKGPSVRCRMGKGMPFLLSANCQGKADHKSRTLKENKTKHWLSMRSRLGVADGGAALQQRTEVDDGRI